MKRTKLKDRHLPRYSPAEELVNTLSHSIGAVLGVAVLLLCATKTARAGNIPGLAGSVIYGCSMILLYTVSAVYHALLPGTAKKVLQVLDHCTIYLLICGTYTPILLSAIIPCAPGAGWGLLTLQWGISVFAIILNAVDLKRFHVFSYLSYIIIGWSIVFIVPYALKLIAYRGLLFLLLGGISYTVGAVLYAIGSKRPWFHSVFHIFVVAGSFLQFLAIYLYII